MKVLAKDGPLLSNAEVMDHVTLVKQQSASIQNLQTICVEIQAYLRERPAANIDQPQTHENIANFIREIKENNLALEKAEILQIVNSAPDNWPVLFCLVEEADIRFSEEQLQLVLDLSQKYLGQERIPS